ncbi:MAG: TetR family transcriptional regulator [Leifsonia sp.]
MASAHPFHRARSDAQRAERRESILAAASAMLVDQRVSELTLTGLAHRVGLAKSNVLRYFESREAILLEVYEREFTGWLDALESRLAADSGAAADVDGIATAIGETAADRPVLCDLCSSAAAVLERNISAQVAADHKRAVLLATRRLGRVGRPVMPHPTETTDLALGAGTVIIIGGVWEASQPADALDAAYAADPGLAVLRIEPSAGIRELVATLLAGLRVRPPVL